MFCSVGLLDRAACTDARAARTVLAAASPVHQFRVEKRP